MVFREIYQPRYIFWWTELVISLLRHFLVDLFFKADAKPNIISSNYVK